MIRKRFTTIILIILLTILPIVSVVMMYHITLCETLSQMDSGCFGDTNVLYKISESATKEALAEKTEALHDRAALYAEQKNEGVTVKAIYFNKYYVNFPMKSGRFFRKSDLTVGNKVAVIGKNLEASCYSRDDKKYILLEGQEYEVVGVIGYAEETIIDNYVYVNMLASENVVKTNLYTLDLWGEKSAVEEEFYNLISVEGLEIKELANVQSYGMTVFPKILYGRWFIWLFLCNILCIAVVSVQWIKLQKQEIGIRRLVGESVIGVVCRMTAKYLSYVGISVIISVVVCVAKFSGYLRSLSVGYAITLPVMLVILIVNVIGTAKTPLVEAIK